MRRMVVEGPSSIGARSRLRRWRLFQSLFPDISSMTVLDLGGTTDSWARAPVRPRHVTVLNLVEPGNRSLDHVLPVLGDACDPPASVVNHKYDLVFSNSLIEHVGGHAQRTRLSENVASLAPSYWVQTPYRYFPIEPHFLAPGLQFLPTRVQAQFVRHWPLVHTPPRDLADALSTVQWTELIGITQMRTYFSDADILLERFGGIPKSMVAVRVATT